VFHHLTPSFYNIPIIFILAAKIAVVAHPQKKQPIFKNKPLRDILTAQRLN